MKVAANWAEYLGLPHELGAWLASINPEKLFFPSNADTPISDATLSTDDVRKEVLNYCIRNDADYEDALQCFCALKHNRKAIITNDTNFPNIDIKLIRTHY